MLTQEENQLVTQVGTGTPVGNLMRRYWLPALLSNELPTSDCPPVRVKILGEDLVAFRDSNGNVGLLEEYCPHRLASLFLGRNEEAGLRCVYHGWKFDVSGQCVDMPSEPAESNFKSRIRLTSYPVIEAGGIVWTYMGPTEHKPPLPDFEWMRAAESNVFVSRTLEYANYLQTIEGGVDTAHISFLHNNNLADRRSLSRRDLAPRLEVERTDYGFRYAGIRDAGEDGTYVRVYQFVMPFHQMRPAQAAVAGDTGTVPQVRGHMWVPIDDYSTWVYNWTYAADPARPLTPQIIADYEAGAGRGAGHDVGNVRTATRENDWLIDREVQRTKTFTGIPGLNTQDLAVQESMGSIVPRWRERLGSTDLAVITLRQIFLDSARNLEGGIEPPGLDPATYRDVRSADLVIPKGTRWQDEAAEALIARA